MKMVLESLASSNDEKVAPGGADVGEKGGAVTPCVCVLQERRIKELEESLNKCQNVQEQVKGQSLTFVIHPNV